MLLIILLFTFCFTFLSSSEFRRIQEKALRDTKSLPITVLLRYRRDLIGLLNSNKDIENAQVDVVLDGVETNHPVARVVARTGSFNSGQLLTAIVAWNL